MWRARRNGFTPEESFQFASYRSAADASGDFVLLDGFNGASRNPYHTFAILELRLGAHTLLKGYRNQLLTRADGLVEPEIAMNAALRYRDAVGPAAIAVGEVPDAAYCNWRRTLAQRTGQYALIVDDLKPGVVMSRATGVAIAAAGWAHQIPEIHAYMRENCDFYFESVEQFGSFILEGN